ncbi:MAG TPA: uracil-DNA glycosylase [Acidimicrobiales bacterium]
MEPLARLEAEIVACRACPRLVAWREQVALTKRAAFRDDDYWGRPVPGFGDPAARVCLVGLAPAAHGANRTGRMFTGDRSGEFLYAALWRTGFANRAASRWRDDGLTLSGAWITAPVRCAPPGNRPTPAERDRCRPYLERELALLGGVRALVPLGQFGYQVLCTVLGVGRRPRFAHGLEVPLPDGRTIVCSYHVSQQNTFTGRLTEPMFDAVLLRARALAGLPPPLPAGHPGGVAPGDSVASAAGRRDRPTGGE